MNYRYVITCDQIPTAIGKKRGKVTGQKREKEKETMSIRSTTQKKKALVLVFKFLSKLFINFS